MALTTIKSYGIADEAITEAKIATDVTTISGTSHTLAAADASTLLAFTNAGAITLTLPTNASVPIDAGTTFRIAQVGAGVVTVAGDTGVDVDTVGTDPKTAGQYAVAMLIKRATDDWLMTGSVEGADNVPSPDPHFDDVALLLAMDGANNSTTFTDRSNNQYSVTANGNAKISTADYVFGDSSAYFDGTGDYLSISHDSGQIIGTQDFEISYWARPIDVSVADGHTIISKGDYTTNGFVLTAVDGGTSKFLMRLWIGGNYFDITDLDEDTWYHFHFARLNNTIYTTLNGILQGSAANSTNISSTEDVYIGAVYDSTLKGFFYGYLDDFRWTIGTARLGPPSAANPTH